MDNFDQQFDGIVCGIDEVGRGPLSGPVVAASVIILPETLNAPEWSIVTDSKKLTAKKREMLYDFILESTYYGIAEVSSEEIDTLNIHHATLLAMKKAYEQMVKMSNDRPALALIDGKFAPQIACATQTVIKGDSLSRSIGAASIIAKVYRDRLMVQYHKEYPHYAWDRNSGYGTKAHMEGIEKNGITKYHRLSFAPCLKAHKRAL